MNCIIHQAMTDALKYVDSCNATANDPFENNEAPEISGMESSVLSKDAESRYQALSKTNEKETLDKGLKLL